MKKVAAIGVVVFSLAVGLWFGLSSLGMKWPGVDEAVVEKFAREANRPPKSFVHMDHGDLLLFLFLAAGAAGGFVGGYFFRELFPPKTRRGSPDA